MPLSILHIAMIAVVAGSAVGADPELVDRAKLAGAGCQQTDTCLAPSMIPPILLCVAAVWLDPATQAARLPRTPYTTCMHVLFHL